MEGVGSTREIDPVSCMSRGFNELSRDSMS